MGSGSEVEEADNSFKKNNAGLLDTWIKGLFSPLSFKSVYIPAEIVFSGVLPYLENFFVVSQFFSFIPNIESRHRDILVFNYIFRKI